MICLNGKALNAKKVIILFSVLLLIIAAPCAVFMHYEHDIFSFTATNYGICPADRLLCDLRKMEQIVPGKEYVKYFSASSNTETLLIGNYAKDSPCFISKYRLEYMFVETRPGLVHGVYNHGLALVNKRFPCPTGYLFRYPLSDLLKMREYSDCIGVQLNEYLYDQKLRAELKSYGDNMFPLPVKYL